MYALYCTVPYLAHAHTARGHGCVEGTPHHVGEQTLDQWSSVRKSVTQMDERGYGYEYKSVWVYECMSVWGGYRRRGGNSCVQNEEGTRD
jgi:hypothetical protein